MTPLTNIAMSLVIFGDVALIAYIGYNFLVAVMRLFNPSCIRISTTADRKTDIKQYIKLLNQNIAQSIETLTEIEGIDKLCDFDETNKKILEWTENRELEINAIADHSLMFYVLIDIQNDIEKCSKIILKTLNDAMRKENCMVRFTYESFGQNGAEFTVHQLVTHKVGGERKIYCLKNKKSNSHTTTKYYIPYDDNIYGFIYDMVYGDGDIDVEETEDITGTMEKYMTILIYYEDCVDVTKFVAEWYAVEGYEKKEPKNEEDESEEDNSEEKDESEDESEEDNY